MSSVPFEPTFRKNPFEQFSRFFLDDPSLPFAKVLPAELSLNALEELAVLVAKNTETIVKPDWLRGRKDKKRKRHAKLVDGFTATMPDTYENQQEFPQHGQERGSALYDKYGPSCGPASSCRSPRRWCLMPLSTNIKARRPANRRCCAPCSRCASHSAPSVRSGRVSAGGDR